LARSFLSKFSEGGILLNIKQLCLLNKYPKMKPIDIAQKQGLMPAKPLQYIKPIYRN
jgi:hypothetical protein